MATSTSLHFPSCCAAASDFSSARKSRKLGATLIWAIAATGLPARRSVMTLLGQGEGRAKTVFHGCGEGRIVRRPIRLGGKGKLEEAWLPGPGNEREVQMDGIRGE